MEMYDRIFGEGKKIVDWVREKGAEVVSAMLFGSAVRGWGEPEDLDVLVVVDEPARRVDELCHGFRNMDLRLSEEYGLYPELTVLRKGSIGKGNTLFYYSVVRDGVVLSGNKDLFIDALVKSEGKEGLQRACGLERAYSFLRHAEKDIQDAKEVTDLQLAAEGAYRACVEAVYALLRRHGMPLPGNHKEERERLYTLDQIYPEANISSRYSSLFEHLHAECFYHGECGHLRKWISKAKKFIDTIANLL